MEAKRQDGTESHRRLCRNQPKYTVISEECIAPAQAARRQVNRSGKLVELPVLPDQIEVRKRTRSEVGPAECQRDGRTCQLCCQC